MAFLCVSVFLIVVSFITCEGRHDYLIKFIIGGKTTDVKNVPYLAIITYDGEYRCGGSIIDKLWIITAAHCVQELQTGYTIRTGTAFRSSGGDEHKIEKIIRYPSRLKDVEGDELNEDLALIKLEKPIKVKKKQSPINLAKSDDELETGKKMQVSGFGVISENGTPSKILRTAFVPIVDHEQCKKLYSYDPPSDKEFCAGYVETGGVDSCFGDSGGPAVFNGKLIGIVKGGDGCARPGFPGIYTKISAFYDWIMENTNLSEE